MKTIVKAVLDRVCFPSQPIAGERVATLELSEDRTQEPFALTISVADGHGFADLLDAHDVDSEGAEMALVDITIAWQEPAEDQAESEDRSLLRELIQGLKACDTCGKPATKKLPRHDLITCDTCAKIVGARVRLRKGEQMVDLSYAEALRRALKILGNQPEDGSPS